MPVMLMTVWGVGLLVAGVVCGAAWVLWRNRGKGLAAKHRTNGVHAGTAAATAEGRAHSLRDYQPQNVGNDASARPWERSTGSFDAALLSGALPAAASQANHTPHHTHNPQPVNPPHGSAPAAAFVGAAGGAASGGAWGAAGGANGWRVPTGFDAEAFLNASKANFIWLQAAWDRSDIHSLRSMMTDDMLAQITAQLAEREQHAGSGTNVTEVVVLEARLLGMEELSSGHIASVEFSGLIREDVSAGPSPFRELWSITRPKTGSAGWLVAGVQALQ
jgi:predicted lipid-binding transport protein (Tim44 family)